MMMQRPDITQGNAPDMHRARPIPEEPQGQVTAEPEVTITPGNGGCAQLANPAPAAGSATAWRDTNGALSTGKARGGL